MEPILPNYNCAQKDLYSALNTLWDNYGEDLADFTAFKASYTVAKKNAAKLAIKNAKEMLDDQARGAAAEQLRIKVAKKADVVIGNFLQTKGYINGVFEKEFRKANYESAGQKSYRRATEDDWESVSAIGTSLVGVNGYLPTNVVLLEDGGNNMPAGFPATVLANVDAFELDYAAFKLASETGVATQAKIKANNACYTTGREMMDDAEIIYRKDFEKAKRYIWDNLLAMINPSVAGMKGTVLNGNTNVGEPAVTVSMKQEGKEAIETVTDVKGIYEISGIEAGTYTVTITKAGFQTIVEIIVIKVGTVSTRNFPLQPN
jgi:hypothetical protein